MKVQIKPAEPKSIVMKEKEAILFHLLLPKASDDYPPDTPSIEKLKEECKLLDLAVIDPPLICKHEDKFGRDFRKAIEFAQHNNVVLVISRFSIIPKKAVYFEWLRESKVEFKILDCPGLQQNPDELNGIIIFLKMTALQKSNKITSALRKRKKQGKELGNPKIKMQEIQQLAKNKRMKMALQDENNTKARKRIVALHEEEKLNFNRIAEQLNKEGFKTRRGKQFHAKSVQRLYDSQKFLKERFNKKKEKEIKGLFERKDEYNVLTQQYLDNSTLPERIQVVGIEPDRNYDDYLELDFGKELDYPVELTIADNQGKIVLKEKIKKGERKYLIDLLKDNRFLPGLHYVRLVAQKKEYLSIFQPINVMKDLL